MLYSAEGVSPIGSPEELAADYLLTLQSLQTHLDQSKAAAFAYGDRLSIYAAHLPPDPVHIEDGSIGRLLIVRAWNGKKHSAYILNLLHLGERHGSIVAPEEAGAYRGNFDNSDLIGHDLNEAASWRQLVEEASTGGLFDPLEAALCLNGDTDEELTAQRFRQKLAAKALRKAIRSEVDEEWEISAELERGDGEESES